MQLNDANSQEGEAVVGSVAHAFSFLFFFFSDLTGSISSSTRFRFLEPSTSPLAEAAAAFSLAFFAFLISFFEIETGLPSSVNSISPRSSFRLYLSTLRPHRAANVSILVSSVVSAVPSFFSFLAVFRAAFSARLLSFSAFFADFSPLTPLMAAASAASMGSSGWDSFSSSSTSSLVWLVPHPQQGHLHRDCTFELP